MISPIIPKGFVVIIFISFGVVIDMVLCERIRFRCDELEQMDTDENSGVYCSVTDFYVNYTTQVDCDVYVTLRKSVRIVKFYNSHMMYVPTGIFRYFTDIRDFDISKSSIVDLQRNTFEGAKHLIYLTMSYNNITKLSASLFIEAPTLFIIDLSYNEITSIDRYTFADVRQLSRLQLNNNKIKSLPMDVFKDLQFLDQIHLNDNEITEIDPNLFATNVQLNKIYLSNNRLHKFDTTIFAKFKYLSYLYLAFNGLTALDTTTFGGQLKLLNVSENRLTTLAIGRWLSIEAENNFITKIEISNNSISNSIKNLYISNNSLTNIENITKLDNLESLDLSFNRIGAINVHTFASLKRLVSLNLAQTNVSNLDFGTFAGQTEMKTLDLSYNNLTEINVIIFMPYMSKLEKLFVDGNNLTELAPLQLYFPVLNTLGISNNNFNCTFLAQFLRQLDTLKVTLNIDPDDRHPNSTHISGIACSNDKIGSSQVLAVHHLNYLNKYGPNVEAAVREKMSYLYKHFNDNPSGTVMTTHVELLESNLRTTKLLLAVVCIGAFVFVSVKFIGAIVQHRNHLLDARLTEQSRSTTTMNTLLQSGLDAI